LLGLALLVSAIATCVAGSALHAQQADSGDVHVRVRESMGMVGGFRVHSEGRVAITDSVVRVDVRPTPMSTARWTTDVWAPLEGFMANVALRFRF